MAPKNLRPIDTKILQTLHQTISRVHIDGQNDKANKFCN